ncbi:uncharacterized protein LOC135711412 [Ochlerotatus camptorhynchus]|uniref:uncharacterized protein LOC135711412 n=1 Tax=Ochlerotatus camptorhynchus TaxID=644619 RepID=UPI0031D45088
MVRKCTTAPASEGPSKKAQTDPSAASDDAANRLLQSIQFSVLGDVAQLRDELAKRKLFPRFKICSVETKIMCSSLQQYKSVGDLLKNSTVKFYTHDLPSMKPLKVVLRGLPSYEAATVKDELDSTTLAELKSNIRDLFQVIIDWEYHKPQHLDVTQCTSCLSFGHGTKNCHMKPRCDKCAMAHSTAICAQAGDTVPKCVNCGGTHLTTTRDCPKRTEFIASRLLQLCQIKVLRRRLDYRMPVLPQVTQLTNIR